TLAKDKKWEKPQNLGYPINTSADEASLFITTNSAKGYYSRQIDHPDNRFTIDLFEFEVPESWKSEETSTYAQGRVFDAETKEPLQAKVQLYDVQTDELMQQVESDPSFGDYTIVLTEGAEYALYVSADNYLMESLSFDYTNKKEFDPLTLDVYLKPIKAGASIVLNNLFFDTGKYTLEQKSKTELNKLITFMQQNKNVKIEISGHTDDVGSDQDNQVLSEKRAKSVVDYLAQNGISKDRIRYKGYGESKPVKENTSEENRRMNRRIELKVL
ncbi:MAG: OmpA family protein, partial [Hymenobacteraceae bacterium]|nr:OmpA family protein [Hymenobacteraceae bacterium]